MTFVPDPRQWVAVDAPLTNAPGQRSPEALRAVLAQFSVESALRYRPRAPLTWCNIFVWDATRALGCEIPHFVGQRPHRRELTANGICDWLESTGPGEGWREVDAWDAVREAMRGCPVVLAWKNPGKGSGHVAMMLPNGNIAQAGRRNLWDAPVEAGFGRQQPLFYVHD